MSSGHTDQLVALDQNGRTGPSSECAYPNASLVRPSDARPLQSRDSTKRRRKEWQSPRRRNFFIPKYGNEETERLLTLQRFKVEMMKVKGGNVGDQTEAPTCVLEIKPSRLHVIRVKSILKASCPLIILNHLVVLAQNDRTGPSSECAYPIDGLARPSDARPLHSNLVERPRPCGEFWRAKSAPIPFSAHRENIFSDSLKMAPTAQ
jgi:hypothetical protein